MPIMFFFTPRMAFSVEKVAGISDSSIPISSDKDTRLRLLVLFLAVTVGFAWYRSSVPYIWDDSPSIVGSLSRAEWVKELQSNDTNYFRTVTHIFQGAFGSVSGGGYRPLASIYSSLTYWLLVEPDVPSISHLLFVGTIYGSFAVCLFCLSRRFVRHQASSWFATLLVLASPPLAATAWVVLTGVQAIVPLLICLALLCYFKMRDPGSHGCARFTLFAILICGPWFREFIGIVPILIVFLELERYRRLTPIMIAAGLCFLHALYPTALIKWTFFAELPLKPVFLLGNLAGSLSSSAIRWQAPWHFLPLFPPSLLVLALGPALVGSWHLIRSKAKLMASENGLRVWFKLLRARMVVAWLALAAASLFTSMADQLDGLILCSGFAVIGIWRTSQQGADSATEPSGYLLPFWFLASFLPMLRVFTEHIHYLYALPPAAFILAREIEELWNLAGNRPLVEKSYRTFLARSFLAFTFCLLSADQMMNLVGALHVNRGTYRGIRDVADWLRLHIPAGSSVVSNVIHGEEIKWHSGEHFENYWTVAAGVCDRNRVVDDRDKLQRLLDGQGSRQTYFLDVDFNYLPGKKDYHRHKFVHPATVSTEFLGVIHQTRARYLFFDPLRHWVAREYVPFLGAPDLVNDFFCGLISGMRPFRYHVYAEYRLFLVTEK